jgi:hypothetical protein
MCLLIVLAGLLRFYRLGDWPFAGDEISTIAEEQSLFGERTAPPDSQIYRLPRIIPLSYLFHHLSDSLVGKDEYGSRVAMAILGALSVGITFFMLDALKGRATATATALLVTLWPEHVFQSQQTRFYIVAAFFSCLCLFIGALAANRRSTSLTILLCCSIIAAVLSHTLMVVLLPITFAGILAGAYAERCPLPKNVVLIFLGTTLGIGFLFGAYLRPLLSHWNADAAWGYGCIHSLFAFINMIGWSVVLLGVLGFLLLCHERNPQNWYWIVCAFGWAGASLVFPLLVNHHPEYVFPLAMSIVVMAGCAVGAVYEELRDRSALLGATWLVLACLGNLPSLVSHYSDGSRPDLRTAAQYVKTHWQTGDRVTGYSMGLFAHYARGCRPTIPLPSSDTTAKLDELTRGQGRLWIVVQSGRSGLSEALRRWLGTHCSAELTVRRTRLDYADFSVDVFLNTPDVEGDPF